MTPSQQRRAILAATVGNGLEFYDFITFAFFAIQIGKTFFPFPDDPFLSLMASLATFGAGFATRPLGAFVLGRYADRHGRKPAMLLSMSLMGAGILLLALTPGYTTIGIAAPVIAVIARLIQGFALGGEVGSATAYLVESADTHHRGAAVSWQGASQQIAATLGSLVGFLLSLKLSDSELSLYGWRIALLLGATIVPFAIWIRTSLPETLHKEPEPDEATHASFRGYVGIIVLGCIMIGSGTIGTYMFNYMATFGQHTLHFSTRTSLFAQAGLNFSAVLTMLWGGRASDRWGRKRVILIPQICFILLLIPVFLWITTTLSAFAFILGTLVLNGIASMRDPAIYTLINESLPRPVRARAFALIYAIPVAVLGGTTQPFIAWLLEHTGNPLSIAIYLTGVATIGLVAMLLAKESSPRHRKAPQ
ncbi:MAG: MFS transporter [Candidatus Andeanibacterium colombiense]|uniref:MFS transporter n=1 Tax=Candidatus Andeanibacterium colombiense TaxID=3121345 RepID=A0AAJ5X730_9SPHN|nr:MAG: MFS transporter [Sphingomonadaceae bacterium]